ncbi:MAG: hypothetical protein ABIF85_03540 [Nanoarchaeota archaeon]|nr:hypothetical protein [Nanoarchaeota archaeon]MBU4451490.1 hypothetical protein [Nanoarchaeota archaeon]MCG2723859.1 hypothetical protein [archaeon]
MKKDIKFETLGKDEKIILLRAFDYDVDSEEYVLTPNGGRIPSAEIPTKFLKLEEAAFIPGSLNIIDGTPASISKFIRETVEIRDGTRNQ